MKNQSIQMESLLMTPVRNPFYRSRFAVILVTVFLVGCTESGGTRGQDNRPDSGGPVPDLGDGSDIFDGASDLGRELGPMDGGSDGGRGDFADASAEVSDTGFSDVGEPPFENICHAYCAIFEANCDAESAFDDDCYLECDPYFGESHPCFRSPAKCPQMGDSLECRLYHAAAAERSGDEHCETAVLGSEVGACAPL